MRAIIHIDRVRIMHPKIGVTRPNDSRATRPIFWEWDRRGAGIRLSWRIIENRLGIATLHFRLAFAHNDRNGIDERS